MATVLSNEGHAIIESSFQQGYAALMTHSLTNTFYLLFSVFVILKTDVNVWCESKILYWLDDCMQLWGQFCLLSVVSVHARKVLFDARKSKRTYLYDLLKATPEYGLQDYHCMICCILLFVETLHDEFLIHKLGWYDCCHPRMWSWYIKCRLQQFPCQLTATLVTVDVVIQHTGCVCGNAIKRHHFKI